MQTPQTEAAASPYARAGLTNAFAAIWLLAGNRPSVYFWGTLLYLLTSGLCNARFVALLLDIIGPDDRDPSTWFSVLLSAGQIRIASMIWLESQTFTKFGTHGLLWTAAAANLLMFAIVAAVFATHGLGLRILPTSDAKPNIAAPGACVSILEGAMRPTRGA